MVSSSLSQWDCIRKNLGTWNGAFWQYSPEGIREKETPSVLTLEESQPGQTMELVLTRRPAGEPEKVNRMTFTAPGPAPYVNFFENGSFSQGSARWSSFGQFATEVSLTMGDRRVRFVIMYQGTPHHTSAIQYVTLICETQAGSPAFAESPLTLAQLTGNRTGSGGGLDAVGTPITGVTSQWQLTSERGLHCHESVGQVAGAEKGGQTLELTGQAGSGAGDNTVVLFSERTPAALDYQLMLLPHGAYCLLPQEIRQGSAFRIEVGWVKANGVRSRLIRYYDAYGTGLFSTLLED